MISSGSFLSPSFSAISFRDRDSVDLCLSDSIPRRFRKLRKVAREWGEGGAEGCSFSVIATEKEIMKMIIISSGGSWSWCGEAAAAASALMAPGAYTWWEHYGHDSYRWGSFFFVLFQFIAIRGQLKTDFVCFELLFFTCLAREWVFFLWFYGFISNYLMS